MTINIGHRIVLQLKENVLEQNKKMNMRILTRMVYLD